LIEYMPNRSIADYLPRADPQAHPMEQSLRWAIQAAEAAAYIHTTRVIHCDISVGNLLLDKDFNMWLCDFQRGPLRTDGTIYLNGESSESVKSSMPRSDSDDITRKADICPLGSAIYFMMTGHQPFPGLHSWKDRLEIVNRFKMGQFFYS
jgi:serine/threonine protein kinase